MAAISSHLFSKIWVKVKTQGKRALIFDEVIVRVSGNFALDMHIDTDEANAAGLKTGDYVELIP
ncbi:hypothetical protein HT574_01890 [Parageobacillus sp. VR-IP]|nr:hypothetical protein [Parageobacillus sp. VR-IP]